MTPVDYVYNGQLIRLCSGSAVKTFMKDPDKYLEKLDEARKKMEAAHAAQMEAAKHTEGHGSCGGH